MKIVIEISEDVKNDFCKRGLQKGVIAQAIEYGTPLPKGKWIYEGDEISGRFKCSNCGEGGEISDFEHFHFCPYCIAEMEVEE